MGLALEQAAAMERMHIAGERTLRDGIAALSPLFESLPEAFASAHAVSLRRTIRQAWSRPRRFMRDGTQPFASAAELAKISVPTLVVPGVDPTHPPNGRSAVCVAHPTLQARRDRRLCDRDRRVRRVTLKRRSSGDQSPLQTFTLPPFLRLRSRQVHPSPRRSHSNGGQANMQTPPEFDMQKVSSGQSCRCRRRGCRSRPETRCRENTAHRSRDRSSRSRRPVRRCHRRRDHMQPQRARTKGLGSS